MVILYIYITLLLFASRKYNVKMLTHAPTVSGMPTSIIYYVNKKIGASFVFVT